MEKKNNNDVDDMLFVDTNIFLEFLLEQKNSTESKKLLFECLEKNLPIVCTVFSIHSIEAILSNRKKPNLIKKFIEELELSTNLNIYSTDLEEEKQVTETMEKTGLDFDDAIQYFVAKKTGCQAMISFDSDFDKTDLKRITPNEWLEKNKETKKA